MLAPSSAPLTLAPNMQFQIKTFAHTTIAGCNFRANLPATASAMALGSLTTEYTGNKNFDRKPSPWLRSIPATRNRRLTLVPLPPESRNRPALAPWPKAATAACAWPRHGFGVAMDQLLTRSDRFAVSRALARWPPRSGVRTRRRSRSSKQRSDACTSNSRAHVASGCWYDGF